jgi:Ca-activated chloride channel family protein
MHIQTDRAFLPAGVSATRYLSVTLSAPASARPQEGPVAARPGVDVSLVLDRSGSMAGRKIELARRAVAHAVRLLKPSDRLGVVAYDHEVDTVLACQPATAAARAQALDALARLEARGSTNLAEGWFTGARALGGHPGVEATAGPAGSPSDRVRRVLLLTDGLANQGVTDPGELRDAAVRLREQGVTTSTFGLGADFDEELLAGLATAGGGHFYFIEQPAQIADFLASELGEVLEVVARDVVFEVAAGAGTRVAVLNPLPVEQEGPVTRVGLGDFVAEQEVTVLLAVHVEPQVEGAGASVLCRVRDREGVLVPAPMQVDWRVVSPGQDRQQPVNREVVLEVARMLAEAARGQALVANRRGGFDSAGQALREAANQIEALAADDEAVRAIARVLLDEEDCFTARMSAAEMKARHFAAYSLSHSREPGGRARKRRADR